MRPLGLIPAAPLALSPPACFGPAVGNAWTLDTKGVNLMRKQQPSKPVRPNALPECVALAMVRGVLVVDIPNDFCHPKDWCGQKGIDVKPMGKPVPATATRPFITHPH